MNSSPSACRRRCAGSCSNSPPSPSSRAARKFAASSRRTNSGAACNISGGTSATRTGICRSSRSCSDGATLEDLPRYEFVTNIYQAFGLSMVSVLSQDVPRVRFFPSSAQAEEDVAAAKAATEVAGLVERNNRIGNLIVEEAFNLWTDGKVGAYVRFVVDGQRFGFHPETEIGAREVKLGDDVYVCPECGAETPADSSAHCSSDVIPRSRFSATEESAVGSEMRQQIPRRPEDGLARDDNARVGAQHAAPRLTDMQGIL